MVTEPNKDLLLRQRTFSIDQTRELLRQGKPVHREAVLEGAVDYNSLMFGEGSEEDNHGFVEAEVSAPDKKNGSWAALVMSNAKPSETKASTNKTAKKKEETKVESKIETKSESNADVKAESKEITRSKDLPKEKKPAGNGEESNVKDRKHDHRRHRDTGNGGYKVSRLKRETHWHERDDFYLGSSAVILSCIRTV